MLWGTGGLVVRLVRDRQDLSTLTISAWRMSLAALVLLAVLVLLRQGRELVTLYRQRPWSALLVGVSTGSYQAFYFAAVVAVGVTVSTVVALGLAPVLLTAAESVAARRRPSARRLGVLVAALGGLVLVSLSAGPGAGGEHPVRGVLLACASGATYALATAVGRPLTDLTTPLALTTSTCTVGAVAIVPFGLLSSGPHLPDDVAVVGLLAYLGVFTLAIAYALLYAGLRTVPGSAAVVATLLEPVTAAVVAALVLGERLGWLGIVGTVLILLAVTGLEREEDDGVPGGPAPL